jgi:excisionase family DNA binding protein
MDPQDLETQIQELRFYTTELERLVGSFPQHPLRQTLHNATNDLVALQQLQTSSKTNTEGNTSIMEDNTNIEQTGVTDEFESETCTVTEAAEIMGVTGQTIRNWVRAGRLVAATDGPGKGFRINRAELAGLDVTRRETRVMASDEQR